MRKLLLVLTILMAAVIGTPRHADASTVTVDSGWKYGEVLSRTDVQAFNFTLTHTALFSFTDCCNAGDSYTISGSIVGVTTFGLAAFTGLPLGLGEFPFALDPTWLNAKFSHFQMLLGPGSYSIGVMGDGKGGFNSGFGLRLDTTSAVPLPAALPLLLAGLAGLGALGMRRKSA